MISGIPWAATLAMGATDSSKCNICSSTVPRSPARTKALPPRAITVSRRTPLAPQRHAAHEPIYLVAQPWRPALLELVGAPHARLFDVDDLREVEGCGRDHDIHRHRGHGRFQVAELRLEVPHRGQDRPHVRVPFEHV